ncbi:MAG TPA: VOC family protein [Candidatus Rubrimentiphilum sp.]|nr:VOC family protein [Candidatus Rubrimentiphilum sp.]
MPNPVLHFEVTGKDAKKLQDFFQKAFDWRLEPAGPDYAMVHTGEDEKIAGGVGKAQFGEGCATFYIGVADLGATLKKIEGLGGRTVTPPVDVPGGPTIAHFTDPEGHLIGLFKLP